MPARATRLAGFALAAVDADGVAGAAGGAGNPEYFAVECPRARFEVERRAVDRVDPGPVLGGFRAGGLERRCDGLTVDGLCYCCVCHCYGQSKVTLDEW